LKSKSTNSIQDDTASALDEARLSKRPSEEEQPGGLPPCTGPYAELDIVNTLEMVKLLGTGADPADMENDLGSNVQSSPSTTTRHQSGVYSKYPPQPETEQQLRSSIRRWSNKTIYKYVYGFGIFMVASSFLTLAGMLLMLAGNEDKLVSLLLHGDRNSYARG
jgi:hypothetical protein